MAQRLSIDQALQVAVTQLNQGHFAECESLCRDVLKVMPGMQSVPLILGTALLFQGRHNESIPEFRKAVELRPNFWNPRFYLAEALQRAHQLREAQETLSAAIAISSFSAGDRALGLAMLGLVFLKMENYKEAVAAHNDAIALAPDRASIVVAIASNYAALGHYRNAIEEVDRALLSVSPTAELMSIKSRCCYFVQRHQDALSSCLQWIDLAHSSECFEHLSSIYESLGNYESAITACQQAISISPQNPRSHERLGRNFLQLDKFQSALGAYNAAVNLEQNESERAASYDGLAQAYSGLNRFAEAADMFDRAFVLTVRLTKLEKPDPFAQDLTT